MEKKQPTPYKGRRDSGNANLVCRDFALNNLIKLNKKYEYISTRQLRNP